MIQSGIQHYYNDLSLQDEVMRVFYDFSTSSLSSLSPAVVGLHDCVSTITPNYISGGIYLTGNSLDINNADKLLITDWSIIESFDKINKGNCLLFSCFETGYYNGQTGYLGYNVGITDSNNLFFESKTNSGNYINISNTQLYEKNTVLVSKNGDTLSLGVYNFQDSRFEIENFILNGEQLFPSNYFSLGGKNNDWNPFSGILNSFIFMSGSQSQSNLDYLCNGFKQISKRKIPIYNYYIDYLSGINNSFPYNTNDILLLDSSGTVYDFCGNQYSALSVSGVTGINISGEYKILNEVNYYQNDSIEIESYLNGTELAKEYGPNSIAFLKNIHSGDFVKIQCYDSGKFNNVIKFNGVDRFGPIQGTNLNVYVNGLLQSSGTGFYSQTNLYNQQLIISGDYFITGNNIIFKSGYNSSDVVIYDDFNGLPSIQFSGMGFSEHIFNQNFIKNNSVVTINGLKKTINVDYIENCGIDLINGNDIIVSGKNIFSLSETENNFFESLGFFFPSGNNLILNMIGSFDSCFEIDNSGNIEPKENPISSEFFEVSDTSIITI